MPIYEFACDRCRKVFQFFFRTVNIRKKPTCPQCGKRGLKRRMSGFAVRKSGGENREERPEPDIDPIRFEKAMAKLERHVDEIDESNPREMGRFMRHMMKESGMELDSDMETAISRLEAGEDPERIEEDMGGVLGDGPSGTDEYGYDDNLYEA